MLFLKIAPNRCGMQLWFTSRPLCNISPLRALTGALRPSSAYHNIVRLETAMVPHWVRNEEHATLTSEPALVLRPNHQLRPLLRAAQDAL